MEIDFSNLHHAYLVIGGSLEGERAVHEFFASHAVRLTGSPDFFLYKEPLFGIEEARGVSVVAARRAFTERKVFLIAPERITLEAQNALLKTFEEPVPSTHFFLVSREENLIIPTLRSRMEIVRMTSLNLVRSGQGSDLSSVSDAKSDAKKFLKLPLKERLTFAKKFAERELNVSVFLDELLIILKESNSTKDIKEVYPLRLESDGRAVSARLILEHLSLVL
ncbi:MAG: hypothetical protein EXS69_00120 [Candidatus Zambryskibacteria bacterium]|nr:hypothetical protein [Candidatus Zambryskibacteria bacterium]